MLNLTRRSDEQQRPRDTLVIISDDGTADIVPVLSKDEERICGGYDGEEYAVPAGDVKSCTGRNGRVFLYPSTLENVEDCKRLASLEKSIVLRQITQYEPPLLPMEKRNLAVLLPWFLIVILVIIVAVK